MRLFFAFLSACYIFLIFFLADSAVVNHLSRFNPYSLLHIPLYGLLTILLFLSINSEGKSARKKNYLFAALIAGAVGILDEVYQSFLPNRQASPTDILLDFGGVILGLYFSKPILFLGWNIFKPKKVMMPDQVFK